MGKSHQSLHPFIFFTVYWDSQPQNIFLCNAGTAPENNHAEVLKGTVFLLLLLAYLNNNTPEIPQENIYQD